MQTDSTRPSYDSPRFERHPSDPSAAGSNRNPGLGEARLRRNPAEGAAAADADDGLEQLPFSQTVKILSEVMKAQVRGGGQIAADGALVPGTPMQGQGQAQAQGDDGKAAASLHHLLDALGSALDHAGLEKGSQAALTRILGEIRNSAQYGPPQPGGKGGVMKGPNPGLLNVSA